MTYKATPCIGAAIAALCFLEMQSAGAQIGAPEIPVPSLPDIAMVRMTPQGPVIFYNPILCAQAGVPLCTFYRYHEYGHVVLGHGIRNIWPEQMEMEADCWAGANAPPIAVSAALQWFLSGGGTGPIHGPGMLRAKRVGQCAGLEGF